MKRLLPVVISTVCLSAWGQAGVDTPKTENAAAPVPHDGVLVMVRPSDLSNVLDLQNGCPVHIVNASFMRPGQLMLTSQTNTDKGPTLHLDYRNLSGKDIDSVVLTGWIKVKESPYQLDSVTRPFHLELSRKALLSKGVEATQALKLADNAIGLDRIELSQVLYTDGTTWKPEKRNCVYGYAGSLEQAAK